MIGAIIGDIVGSIYEFNPIKTCDFPLIDDKCHITDDTIMTIAVADSLLAVDADNSRLMDTVIDKMRYYGRKYPRVGYGNRFARWLMDDGVGAYNSFGNGGAMRISPVAYVCNSIDDVELKAELITKVTHNHIEGLKGAKAVAVAIFLARTDASKADIKKYICEHYYDIDFTLDEIRNDYTFHVDSMHSVPEAIEAFLESDSFEDAVRKAVSLGGDADTQAAIAGSIAEAYYGIPHRIANMLPKFLDGDLLDVVHRFESKYNK